MAAQAAVRIAANTSDDRLEEKSSAKTTNNKPMAKPTTGKTTKDRPWSSGSIVSRVGIGMRVKKINAVANALGHLVIGFSLFGFKKYCRMFI
jgi:hypothetical protein